VADGKVDFRYTRPFSSWSQPWYRIVIDFHRRPNIPGLNLISLCWFCFIDQGLPNVRRCPRHLQILTFVAMAWFSWRAFSARRFMLRWCSLFYGLSFNLLLLIEKWLILFFLDSQLNFTWDECLTVRRANPEGNFYLKLAENWKGLQEILFLYTCMYLNERGLECQKYWFRVIPMSKIIQTVILTMDFKMITFSLTTYCRLPMEWRFLKPN